MLEEGARGPDRAPRAPALPARRSCTGPHLHRPPNATAPGRRRALTHPSLQQPGRRQAPGNGAETGAQSACMGGGRDNMGDADKTRLRSIDAELRAVAREGFSLMHEDVVRFGFHDGGLTYTTVMEAGCSRQAELSMQRRYYREPHMRVHSIGRSSSRGRPYDPYILAVQAGVISREEASRRSHDPDDPVKMRRGGSELSGPPRFGSGSNGCAGAVSVRVSRGSGSADCWNASPFPGRGLWCGDGEDSHEAHQRKSGMVAISLSGSGEGLGRAIARGYSIASTQPPTFATYVTLRWPRCERGG